MSPANDGAPLRMIDMARAVGLRSLLRDPKAAYPCPHCRGLDDLDHEDDCPAENARRVRVSRNREDA